MYICICIGINGLPDRSGSPSAKGATEAAEEGAEEVGRPAMAGYLVADWLQGHVLTEIDGSSD